MRCKHPFKKSISRALADLALQFRYAAFGPALLSLTRKYIAWPLANLTPPAVQHVWVHFQRPRHLAD
jgi:hypothetical protein